MPTREIHRTTYRDASTGSVIFRTGDAIRLHPDKMDVIRRFAFIFPSVNDVILFIDDITSIGDGHDYVYLSMLNKRNKRIKQMFSCIFIAELINQNCIEIIKF